MPPAESDVKLAAKCCWNVSYQRRSADNKKRPRGRGRRKAEPRAVSYASCRMVRMRRASFSISLSEVTVSSSY
jgi:hypothetical protein